MPISLRRPSPGAIASGFGPRAGGHHDGIDFGWGKGWEITAAAAGVVRWAAPGAGYGARYGNLTIIDHGGFETRYAHQSQMWVRPGYKVSAGEGIGLIGGSGANGLNTYDPHLHFELLIGGKRVNPAPYFTSTAGGDTRLILEQEEEDMIDSMFAIVDGVPSWCWMNWATGKLYAVYTQKDADWIGKYMGSINPDFVFNGADGGDLYKNKLAMFKLLTGAPATVDVAALAKELSPLLSGIDETALATALAAALEPEFAAIHANIDDQPTEFKITPN